MEYRQMLGNHLLAQSVFRQHSHDCLFENSVWVFDKLIFKSDLFESSWVACMMSIDLLLPLPACKHRVCHIDYYAFVSILEVVLLIAGSVLAPDELTDKHCHPSYWHSLGIEQMVSDSIMVDCTILTHCLGIWLMPIQPSVLKVDWNSREVMSNIWIEWDLGKFFFWLEPWEISKLCISKQIGFDNIFFLLATTER